MQHKMKDTSAHSCALYHMMGQLEDMGRKSFSTGEIAQLMGVSMPTALRRLEGMRELGTLNKEVIAYRSNAVAFRWSLSMSTYLRYGNGIFVTYFERWKDEAFSDKWSK